MSRPDRASLIATTLTMLVFGCDLTDDKDDKRANDEAGDGMDAGADDGEDDESGGDDGSGDDGSGGGGGTGSPLTECQQCAAVNCEEETTPCATDDVCQECVWEDPHAEQCDGNEAWQTALACACDVCPDACADIC
jgi:hypothetical protein